LPVIHFQKSAGTRIFALAIPRERFYPADAVQRNGDVAAISNDVDDQRIGKQPFDERQVKAGAGAYTPPSARHPASGDRFHQDSEEVSGIAAFFEYSRLNLFARQAGTIEQLALQPMVEEFPPISAAREVSEAQTNQIESIALRVIQGETARREQGVIQELGARATQPRTIPALWIGLRVQMRESRELQNWSGPSWLTEMRLRLPRPL